MEILKFSGDDDKGLIRLMELLNMVKEHGINKSIAKTYFQLWPKLISW